MSVDAIDARRSRAGPRAVAPRPTRWRVAARAGAPGSSACPRRRERGTGRSAPAGSAPPPAAARGRRRPWHSEQVEGAALLRLRALALGPQPQRFLLHLIVALRDLLLERVERSLGRGTAGARLVRCFAHETGLLAAPCNEPQENAGARHSAVEP